MAVRIHTILGTTALALALAAGTGCASTSPTYGSGYAGSSGYDSTCGNCGTVTQITVGGASGTTGALIGGLIGAVAGHEVSAQTGGSKGNQNISTVAGAAAGAAAGSAIQKNRSEGYTVHVRMDDGRTVKVTQSNVSGFREGSRVRIDNGQAYLR
ncbi:glycine zipper 2TM domain-containing protein [Thermomonas fusca]|uniref:Glycine zipper 2TM domain-containing protein n=1 Tax=Thermomonas fusca TaxID=215690 RepID=A0A5R9PCK3_9GAMM|nr:glycine zipper 2TM domain-containing protein [Thermomonas fusca]TLX21271.1 glycine zipper 2TM domain-containing protein [Thermomonas fusca]